MILNITHNPGVGESDHECLMFSLECYKDDEQNIETRPNYYKADFKTIHERFHLINWTSVFQGNFLDDYLKFVNLLEKAMEGCVPSYTSTKVKKSIYLTPEAIRLKNLKIKFGDGINIPRLNMTTNGLNGSKTT